MDRRTKTYWSFVAPSGKLHSIFTPSARTPMLGRALGTGEECAHWRSVVAARALIRQGGIFMQDSSARQRRLFLALAGILLAASGCGPPDPPVNFPGAGRTADGSFSFTALVAILTPGGQFTTVGPSAPSTYAILGPGRRGSFGLWVYAPLPSTFDVKVDGVTVVEGVPAHGDTAAHDAGYWYATLRNTSTTPAIYEIAIIPPIAKAAVPSFVAGVRNVSRNPGFVGDTNPQHISQTSVSVTLVRQPSSVVDVTILNGKGIIQSQPAGLFCPPTCSFDFPGAPNPVLVHASASTTFAFTSWSGACAGSSPTCMLPMNGMAQGVTASFVKTGSTMPPTACPAPALVPGKSYFMSPMCDAHLLGAIIQCDGTRFFCCFTSDPSFNDPVCGAGHKMAPATCGIGTAPDNPAAPTGCYL